MKKLKRLGRWSVPQRYKPNLRLYMAKAGYQETPYHFFGVLLLASIATTVALYAVLFPFLLEFGIATIIFVSLTYFLVGNLLFYVVTMGAAAFYFNMKIYNRTKEIEENLPEMLTIVSANLKGGMSFDQALWKSIRPEFGVLSEEMAIVSKKVMVGQSLKDALGEFTQKYESPILRRTMHLMMGELGSGGKISWLLDKIIVNLRKTRELKQEMSSNTLTFVIFITAIVVFIAPILFSLAYALMGILLDISGEILPQIQDARDSGAASQLPDVPNIDVDMWNFRAFSILAIGIISIFSSMIISIIQRGEIMAGIKYIPFFVGMSITVYLVSVSLMSGIVNF